MTQGDAYVTWRDQAIAVIEEVSKKEGISPSELLGYDRKPHIVRARHEAMLEVRERMKLSYPVIGELFARDHTTVIRGCRGAMRRRAA